MPVIYRYKGYRFFSIRMKAIRESRYMYMYMSVPAMAKRSSGFIPTCI
jgi:hypothetical protein